MRLVFTPSKQDLKKILENLNFSLTEREMGMISNYAALRKSCSSFQFFLAILSISSLVTLLESFLECFRALTFDAPLKSPSIASSISFSVMGIL